MFYKFTFIKKLKDKKLKYHSPIDVVFKTLVLTRFLKIKQVHKTRLLFLSICAAEEETEKHAISKACNLMQAIDSFHAFNSNDRNRQE